MPEQSPGVFVLSPAYFRRLRLTFLVGGVAVALASIALARLTGHRTPTTGLGTEIFIQAFVYGIVGVVFYFSCRKQVARWRTFRIEVSSDAVIRKQEGFTDVIAAASAITRLVRIRGRGLSIYTGRAQPAILIPDTLERFDDCCALIQRFAPIDDRARPALPRWLALPAGIAYLGLYVAFDRSSDLRVMGGLAALYLCVMGVGAWRIYGNPDVDPRTKKRLVWVLLVVGAPMGMRIWSTWNAPHRMEQEIRNDRLLSLLDKARPDLHDRLRDALVVGLKNRQDAHGGNYVNPLWGILIEVFPQYLPVCSDEAIIRYVDAWVTVLRKLEADPSNICYQWLRPHGAHVNTSAVLGQDGMTPLTEAMAGVVESGLAAPQPAPDATVAEPLRARALATLTDAETQTLQQPDTPAIDQKAWCQAMEKNYASVLALPPEQSGLVLRYIFSITTRK